MKIGIRQSIKLEQYRRMGFTRIGTALRHSGTLLQQTQCKKQMGNSNFGWETQ